VLASACNRAEAVCRSGLADRGEDLPGELLGAASDAVAPSGLGLACGRNSASAGVAIRLIWPPRAACSGDIAGADEVEAGEVMMVMWLACCIAAVAPRDLVDGEDTSSGSVGTAAIGGGKKPGAGKLRASAIAAAGALNFVPFVPNMPARFLPCNAFSTTLSIAAAGGE